VADDLEIWTPRKSVCRGRDCKKRLTHKDPKTGAIVKDAHFYDTPEGLFCDDCFSLRVAGTPKFDRRKNARRKKREGQC
jgi:hypothetical protein